VTPLSTLLPPIPNSIPLRGQVKGTKYPVFTLCCALKSPAPEARLLSPGSRAQLGRQQGGGLRDRTAVALFSLVSLELGRRCRLRPWHCT
jgi:hypothetical protein